MFNNIVQY